MPRGPRPAKIEEWSRRLERLKASGASVAEFCKAESVSAASVYYWKKRLDPMPQAGTPAENAFKRVELLQHRAPATGLTVRLPGNVEIAVGHDASMAELVLDKVLDATNAARRNAPC